MARRVFFSFHYQSDVFRSNVVKKAWVGRDREDAGFFDASVFEATKRTSPDALRRFLREGLSGSSVACALTGTDTAKRPWVRFEMLQALRDGRGLMEIAIHGIRCASSQSTAQMGPSVLASLGYWADGGQVHFIQIDSAGKWNINRDVPAIPASEFYWQAPNNRITSLDTIFSRYDWVGNSGYVNLGAWVEKAATQAGR